MAVDLASATTCGNHPRRLATARGALVGHPHARGSDREAAAEPGGGRGVPLPRRSATSGSRSAARRLRATSTPAGSSPPSPQPADPGLPRLALAARAAAAGARALRHALGGGERRLHGDQPPARPDGRGGASLAALAALDRQLLERRRQPHHREDLRLGGDRLLHPARPAHDARTCPLWVRRGAIVPAVAFVALARRSSCCSGGGARSSSSGWLVRWLPERFGRARASASRARWSTACACSGDPALVARGVRRLARCSGSFRSCRAG